MTKTVCCNGGRNPHNNTYTFKSSNFCVGKLSLEDDFSMLRSYYIYDNSRMNSMGRWRVDDFWGYSRLSITGCFVNKCFYRDGTAFLLKTPARKAGFYIWQGSRKRKRPFILPPLKYSKDTSLLIYNSLGEMERRLRILKNEGKIVPSEKLLQMIIKKMALWTASAWTFQLEEEMVF